MKRESRARRRQRWLSLVSLDGVTLFPKGHYDEKIHSTLEPLAPLHVCIRYACLRGSRDRRRVRRPAVDGVSPLVIVMAACSLRFVVTPSPRHPSRSSSVIVDHTIAA